MQAERLREVLTTLGPAFVKIGQVLSAIHLLLHSHGVHASLFLPLICVLVTWTSPPGPVLTA